MTCYQTAAYAARWETDPGRLVEREARRSISQTSHEAVRFRGELRATHVQPPDLFGAAVPV
jgi:hypothetical protein